MKGRSNKTRCPFQRTCSPTARRWQGTSSFALRITHLDPLQLRQARQCTHQHRCTLHSTWPSRSLAFAFGSYQSRRPFLFATKTGNQCCKPKFKILRYEINGLVMIPKVRAHVRVACCVHVNRFFVGGGWVFFDAC